MPFTKPSQNTNNNKPHLIVDAGPGSGKTTTMIAGLGIILGKKPSWYKDATEEQLAIWEAMEGNYATMAFQAFNKSIAEEIKTKVPPRVKASTFHSFGYKVMRESGLKCRMSQINDKIIVKELLDIDRNERMEKKVYEKVMKVCKFIGLMKNNLLFPNKTNLLQIANHYGIEVNGDIKEVEQLVSAAMTKIRDGAADGSLEWISFDDMLWLPVVNEMSFETSKVDLLICDEFQDLNPVQHEMVRRSTDRLIGVGDPRQAIYGFRGASENSMTIMEERLGKEERGVQQLPLLTSFRLPVSGVENVIGYAPGLKPRKNAPKGSIKHISLHDINKDQMEGGDLVLSRVNSNIFMLAFRLLRQRVAVRIEGRDFGKQLVSIINKHSAGESIAEVESGLRKFDQDEMERLEKKEFGDKLIDAHEEKMSCLYSLMAGCEDLSEMVRVIESLFDNDLPRKDVVLLSTIHRAKGLEAKKVYFVEPNLIPHRMAEQDHERKQEYNLKFVAETRHLDTLFYVHPNERMDDDRDELAVPAREDLMDING